MKQFFWKKYFPYYFLADVVLYSGIIYIITKAIN